MSVNQQRILYQAKLYSKIEDRMKLFSNKQKLKK